MVFVVNGKGTNSKFRNLVRDSSFESPDFTIAPNPNAGNYSDIAASTCVPTGGGGNYPELTNTEYVISSFHANNNLSCRCPKATAAEVTRLCSFELTQMVPVDGGKTYTLSYAFWHYQHFLFKGMALPPRLDIEKVCKIMEFLV